MKAYINCYNCIAKGMKAREMLSGTPELGLKNAITYHDDVDQYGNRVFQALKKVIFFYMRVFFLWSEIFGKLKG